MNIDELQKEELKSELSKRGEDVRGTKAVLKERLQQVLKEEAMDGGKPPEIGKRKEDIKDDDDGNSAVSSSKPASSVRTSASIRSERAIEKAKHAGLLVKKQALLKKHHIEAQEAQLRKMKEELELQAEIDECVAKEEVLGRYEDAVTENDNKVMPVQEDLKDKEHRDLVTATGEETRWPRATKKISREPGVAADEVENSPAPESEPHVEVRASSVSADLQLMKRINLPELKLGTFDGKAEAFKPFMRAFETNIASKLNDEFEKLMYLMQMTSGKVREIVSTCVHLPPDRGYKEAVNLLNRRYSNNTQTVSSLIEGLVNHPSIKPDDVDALDTFSIHLRGAYNALQSIPGGISDVGPKTIGRIVEKLPFGMMDRWRREADRIEHDEKRTAELKNLVDLVEQEARVARHPVYGRQALSTQRKDAKVTHTKHLKAMTGTVRTDAALAKRCRYCNGDHKTDVCNELARKSDHEKKIFTMQKGLCFSCLEFGHRAKDCRLRATCQTCKKRHPTALHRITSSSSSSTEAVTTGHIASNRVAGGAKLQAVRVTVKYKGAATSTLAFLDSGSTHSFVSQDLVKKLGMTPQQKTSVILSTVRDESKLESSLVTQVCIEDLQGEHTMELPPMYMLKKISISAEDLPSEEDLQMWSYLSENGVKLEKVDPDCEVGLLIGNNAAAAMEPMQVVQAVDGGPYAVLTRYGWILGGVKKETRTCHLNRISVHLDTDNWFENQADTRKGLSVEDIQWCALMETGCVKKPHGYEIKMPFRENGTLLGNNREQSEKRLETLKRRFEKEEVYAAEYTAQMAELLQRGYIEEAPEASEETGKWYLPHFGVRNPAKKKVRVVFDCAAKHNGRSLNDNLLQGPDLTNSVFDVLVRFREHPYAFTGDIEAMFMQVEVPESQRDFLRFLWWADGDVSAPPREYRNTRHLFGAKSSPSCANLALHMTADDHGGGKLEACDTIRQNFYVDDVLKSVRSEEAAVSLVKDLKDVCASGGFNLTKFNSNSARVLESVASEDRAREVKFELNADVHPVDRALGVLWDTRSDTFGFQIDVDKLKRKPVTKRGMLSVAASCYDPLGLVAPCIVKGRAFIQELFRLKVPWDARVPDMIRERWERWLHDLRHLEDFRVPRCISPRGAEPAQIELHHFADASTKAYGTVSYMRTVYKDGSIHCALLTSKARLVPLKSISVPRLELTAAKLAVQVGQELSRALSVEVANFYWTDSTTVLKYIQNVTTRFHVFVSNRLAVIHDGSSVEQWKYVPTELNPADLVSRGTDASSLSDSELWKQGPAYLWSTSDEWPMCPENMRLEKTDPEVKTSASAAFSAATTATTGTRDVTPREATASATVTECSEAPKKSPVEKLVDHYGSWKRLVRAVALLRRVFTVLKEKSRERAARDDRGCHSSAPRTALTPGDLSEAVLCIVRDAQRRHFGTELCELRAGKEVRPSSRLIRLSPFLEDDIVRVGGRLRNSHLCRATKHPPILPNKDRLVELLIQDVHQRAGHEGRQHVLADLGREYWILGANSAVRRTLSRCVSCRRRQRPPESQRLADLPEDRVREGEKPFSSTGVDYFGPFFVKRGRGQVKKYGVIFTCLVVRAIHIEVAESLTTDSFLCALRRFVARRGTVRLLRSDQGTNFIGAERELRDELSKLLQKGDEIRRAALEMNIEWRFNPPHASHCGGAWERQIRTVRKILGALMTQQSLTDETLHTLLCEAECIVNNRPLLPVSADPRDDLPITPNHLLHTSCVTLPPSDSPVECDLVGKKQWKQAAYLAEIFWRRWRREYLPFLQQRPGPNTRSKANVKRGDVVLLVDESVPRGVWPMGRVEEAIPSADGRVRSVRVLARGTIYYRPVNKIVKIVGGEE